MNAFRDPCGSILESWEACGILSRDCLKLNGAQNPDSLVLPLGGPLAFFFLESLGYILEPLRELARRARQALASRSSGARQSLASLSVTRVDLGGLAAVSTDAVSSSNLRITRESLASLSQDACKIDPQALRGAACGDQKIDVQRARNPLWEGPKSSQDRPGSSEDPLERPKSVPRGSQEASRAPQERPRAPQERPKAPQERPQSAQEGPKTPLEPLRGALGDHFDVCKLEKIPFRE